MWSQQRVPGEKMVQKSEGLLRGPEVTWELEHRKEEGRLVAATAEVGTRSGIPRRGSPVMGVSVMVRKDTGARRAQAHVPHGSCESGVPGQEPTLSTRAKGAGRSAHSGTLRTQCGRRRTGLKGLCILGTGTEGGWLEEAGYNPQTPEIKVWAGLRGLCQAPAIGKVSGFLFRSSQRESDVLCQTDSGSNPSPAAFWLGDQ